MVLFRWLEDETCERWGYSVPLDSDLLWRPEFNTPDTGYAECYETWLRLAVAIHQPTGPVILFGDGLGVPDNLEGRLYRRYLGRIHYLALICPDDVWRNGCGRARPGAAPAAMTLCRDRWRIGSKRAWSSESQSRDRV